MPESWGKEVRKVAGGKYGQRFLCLKGEVTTTIERKSSRV